MLFNTRRLASLLCFSVKTIALGINCRGSGLCDRASFLNNNDASIIQTLRDVVHATSLPDKTVYNSGDHIVCVSQSSKITISPTFTGQIGGFSAGTSIGLSGSIDSGGICLFPQGASLTLGSIKPLTDAILDHKCSTCGSVPIHFVDQGSNDPGAGILTFNYVAAPTCDRNCISSLESPDSGKSPSSQPAQQPSKTPQQQPKKSSKTPVQQPTTQPSVTPVTTQPRVTEPLTVIQQPFTSPSEPEPVTIIQTPSSAPSDSSSSSGDSGSGGSGGAASGSDDETGSSADSGVGGAATTQPIDSATQQVVTVVSTQTSDQQGSAASTTQVGNQDAGAAAGPSTVTVAPGSSTAAAGGGVVTVTGGSAAATPSGDAGTSGQGTAGGASPSSGLGLPGSARMADAVWLYFVLPMALIF